MAIALIVVFLSLTVIILCGALIVFLLAVFGVIAWQGLTQINDIPLSLAHLNLHAYLLGRMKEYDESAAKEMLATRLPP